MLPLGIFLIILSPYTALIPAAYMGWHLYRERNSILKKPELYLNPWNLCVAFIFFWAVFVGLINHDKISVAVAFTLPLFIAVSVYMQQHYRDEKKLEKLIHLIMQFSLFSAGIGLLEKTASMFIDMSWVTQLFWSPTYIITKETYRIYSTFGNPNAAGAWFAAMVLVCMYFFERAPRNKKILYGLATVLFVFMLALTGSRGAVLGLQFGFLAFALLKPNKSNMIPVGLAFLMVLVIAIFAPEINHAGNRDYIWSACYDLFKEKPLTGWGFFGIYRNIHEVHGHNIVVTVATTLGLVGLSVYFAMQVFLIRGLRILHQGGSNLVALLGAVQALIIGHGLVDFVILVPQCAMMFFGCSAMIFALTSQYRYVPTAEKGLAMAWRPISKYYGLKSSHIETTEQYRSSI